MKRQSYYVGLTTIILLMLCVTNVYAQEANKEQTISLVSSEVYNQVLDILFPRLALEDDSAEYVFVLRYKPSFSEESQITIVKRMNDVQVFEYRPVNGSIYRKLNDMIQHSNKMTTAEMAKQIQVRKRYIKISPAQLKSLHDNFLERVCLQARNEKKIVRDNKSEVIITTDGTQYILWYKSMGDVSYNFVSSGIRSSSDPSEHPFTSWMKYVERIVNKLSTI